MVNELANYLEDDFDDNVLSSRTNAEAGVFRQYGDGGAGDLLKGVYRPTWRKSNSSYISVSGGTLEVSQGGNGTRQYVQTPSTFTVGEWTSDIGLSADGTATRAYMVIMAMDTTSSDASTDNGYYFLKNAPTTSSTNDLNKRSGGTSTTLISGGSSTTATQTCRVTRDSYGSFEAFTDGTSMGTATDTSVTESRYLDLVCSGDDVAYTATFDNVTVK